jgi:hypothetical protein
MGGSGAASAGLFFPESSWAIDGREKDEARIAVKHRRPALAQ